MAQRITDRLARTIEAPASGAAVVFDASGYKDHVRGFGLKIYAPTRRAPEGKKTFVLDYRAHGRQRRARIGDYPAWSVEAARKRAKELRRQVDNGGDPLAEKEAAREAAATARNAPTVNDLAERYRAEHLPGKAASSQARDIEMLDKNILPALAKRKVAEVHQGDIAALHRRLTTANGPIRANRVLSLLSRMFNLAMTVREGENEAWRAPGLGNPTKGVKRNSEEGRDRFFSPAELDRIASALSEYPGEHVGRMLKFCMLTGCRPNEAIAATWDQIDLSSGSWTKPAATTKQRKVHRLPLAPPAIELLQQAREAVADDCPYVFPGRKMRRGGWEPIKQYRLAWTWVREHAELAPDAEGREARVYDLRHSFASMGVGQGLSLPIIGKLLGHTQARTTQRYAHLADDPAREAAERIGTAITNAGKKPENVVPLRKGRGA